MHEAADDLELPLHATRERLHGLEHLALDTEDRRQLADPVAVRDRHEREERAVREEPVQDRVEPDVLLRGEVQVEAGLLEDDPHGPTHAARVGRQVVSTDERDAGCGRERGGEDRDRGRLARAVRAEEGEELAFTHGEADAVDGVELRAAVALHEVGHDDRARVAGVLGGARRRGGERHAARATARAWARVNRPM